MNVAATTRIAACLIVVLALSATAVAGTASSRSTPTGRPELLERAEVALASGEPRAAHEAWEQAYRGAMHARSTEGLLAVGDAYLRIGEAVHDRSTAVASARRIYLMALFQARGRRDAAGVAAVAAAFSSLGDRETASRGFEIATAIATERGDTTALERIAAFQTEVADARRRR